MIAGCIPSFSRRADERLNELQEIRNGLPTIPSSELLYEEGEVDRSPIPKCAAVHIWQLFGTDLENLEAVTRYYEAAIDRTVWKLDRLDDIGISFTTNQSVHLGISDSYRLIPSLKKIAEKAEQKHETFFLVGLVTFVNPEITMADCT